MCLQTREPISLAVRVKSQRDGDKSEPFTQIKNVDRVRVVVE